MSSISPGMMQQFSIGMGALSSGIGAFSQYERGVAEQRAYNYNADVALQKMKEEEEASREEFTRLKGRQRSLYAKAGVDITSGSPLLVLADTAMREATESQKIHMAGVEESEMDRYYGRIAKWSGIMGAGSTFLSGLNTAAGQLYRYKKGL